MRRVQSAPELGSLKIVRAMVKSSSAPHIPPLTHKHKKTIVHFKRAMHTSSPAITMMQDVHLAYDISNNHGTLDCGTIMSLLSMTANDSDKRTDSLEKRMKLVLSCSAIFYVLRLPG